MPKKETKPSKARDDSPTPVTVERINTLVDAIVPRPGCTKENGNAVALALAELVNMVAGVDYAFSGDVDAPNAAAYFAARAAYQRTGPFEDSLEDWRGNIFEGAVEKGSE